MNSEVKLYVHLFVLCTALVAAIAWVLFALSSVLANSACPEWFQRSGAILVVVAILSSIATRPFVYDHTFSDLKNVWENAMGRADLKPEHWAKKYNVFSVLVWLELVLAICGTLIWSYGDIWVEKYSLVECA